MAAPKTLPNPEWTGHSVICIGCEYSLAGLVAPGICPECSTPFDKDQVLLHGVIYSHGGSPARRLSWLTYLAFAVPYVWFGWAMVIPFAGLWGSLVGFGIVVAWGAVLLITNPRDRKGTQRFVIGRSGIATLPGTAQTDTTTLHASLIPWDAVASIQLQRISSNWKRLRVRPSARGSHVRHRLIAGFRCGDEDAARIQQMIDELSHQQRTVEA